MAEEDTPKRVHAQTDEGEDTPPMVVPSHAPLPPPPDVTYTRPSLDRRQSSTTRPSPMSGSKSGLKSDETNPQTQLSQGVQGYGLAITAAITLAVTLLAFVALGQWLDHRYNPGGTPWFTIVGLLLGVTGGFFNMIRLLTGPSRKIRKK